MMVEKESKLTLLGFRYLMKVYAIIETQYDHDGDRYIEQGQLAPTKLYKNRDKANEILQKELREFYLKENLYDFGDEVDEVISPNGYEILMGLLSMLTIHNEWDPEDYDPEKMDLKTFSKVFKTAVDSIEWSKIQDLIKEVYIKPIYIQEVEIVD